jgi:hypothetical protein
VVGVRLVIEPSMAYPAASGALRENPEPTYAGLKSRSAAVH